MIPPREVHEMPDHDWGHEADTACPCGPVKASESPLPDSLFGDVYVHAYVDLSAA